MSIEKGKEDGEAIANCEFRISKNAYALNSVKISSPLGNYVTIRQTRHSGRVHLRWARSGIQ